MQNFYNMIGLPETATIDQIRNVVFAPREDIAALATFTGYLDFDHAAQTLRHKAAQRDTTIKILANSFRREVYDWTLQADREFARLGRDMGRSTEIDPFSWTGVKWDAEGLDQRLSISSDDFWKRMEDCENVKKRLDASSEPVKLDDLIRMLDVGRGRQTLETRAASYYVASEILKRKSEIVRRAHEQTKTYSLNRQVLNALCMAPTELALRKLFDVWIETSPDKANSATIEQVIYIISRISEADPVQRVARCEIASAIIEKWPDVALVPSHDRGILIGTRILCFERDLRSGPKADQLCDLVRRVAPGIPEP